MVMLPIPEKQLQKNLEEIISLKKELRVIQRRLAIEKERHKKIERTFQVLLNNISDAIIVHDLYGNILYVNDVMLEMYGVKREIAIHLSIVKDLSALNNPIEKLPKIWKTVLSGQVKTMEWNAKRPTDGKEFMVEVVLSRINIEGKKSILATIHNISKSKKIEQELKAEKGFLQNMIDNLPVGVFVKHPDSLEYLLWNKTNEKIFGVSEAEAIGKTAFDIFPKNFANFSVSMDKEALENNKVVDVPEHIFQNEEKKSVILHTKKLPLYDKNGEPQYLICITENITEKKKVEQGIARDIEKASLVQKSILTNQEYYHKIERLEIDVRYHPMNDKIGGDYYNIHKSEDDIVSVVIADVAGHGIQAALSTMQIDLLLRESSFLPLPYQRLGLINSLLFHDMFLYNYFTCFVMNIYKDRVQYACGGHPPNFY
ncbi:MAG: PAS domain S-box protein [Leptospiraceae bacterium]|nr:PAS domain S-box protein [Leptospiraceae bacterium]